MRQRSDVPFERFYAWAAAGVEEKLTLAALAHHAGRAPGAMVVAKRQGVIEGRLVVEYARAVGRSPLEALAESLDMDELRAAPEPSQTEMLSQVPYAVMLEEVAARLGGAPRSTSLPTGGTSGGRWIDALGEMTGARIAALAESVGMEYEAFKSKRWRGTFLPTELHAVSEQTGGTMQVGLVAQGWLTWAETKLAPQGREDTLAAWSTADMFAWLEGAVPELRRAEPKR
ncbi:hypothetical protein [Micrococcus sp. M4NT]|uniref:hypothetical protein n=1 Tax=Micrococcus sp. M4NT TaxID=2957501 RepID=UPI0029BFDFDC|nr:hypothetical protein [Micrococcus sp. M4NT]